MNKILIQVGSHGVSVARVDEKGFADGTGLNKPGRTLRSAVAEFGGPDTLLVVEDCVFNGGYYRVQRYTGLSGTEEQLFLLMDMDERAKIYDANVKSVRTGGPVGPMPLTVVFERAAVA